VLETETPASHETETPTDESESYKPIMYPPGAWLGDKIGESKEGKEEGKEEGERERRGLGGGEERGRE